MELVQLHYRSSEYRGFDDFITAKPEYYQVTEYPVAEMMGTDPVGWAEDFVELTGSEPWRSQNRRRIKPGDIMIVGKRVFLFMAADESGSPGPLPHWPMLAIRDLGHNTSQAILTILNYNDGTSGII